MTHLSQAHASSGKAICPICYENLKPVAEELLSISVCGHVFHELCLHQWQEYCPKGKKCSCPVCKQSYALRDVLRLFFLSTGGSGLNCAKIPQPEADDKTLIGEIETLQGKISALSSALDAQKQRVGQLNSEVLAWKSRAEREEELKTEHQRDKENIGRLLQKKEADLCKTLEDCLRFKEKSLALAKELAAIKLAMDVNLGEEEVAKLVSMARGTTADAIDVLQRSLLLRNKCYKELMAQCNSLGRAETRALKKLEKSEERIKMLKVRLHELEKAVEKKDGEVLSVLKFSNQKFPEQLDRDISSASHNICDTTRQYGAFGCSFPSSSTCVSIDDDSNTSDPVDGHASDTIDTASAVNFIDADGGFHMPPSIQHTDKSSMDCSRVFADASLPDSLTGTEDTTKYPKWRKTPLKVNPSMQTSNNRGGLIALGADGRGGTVKVLRGLDKFSEGKVCPLFPKQCKRRRALPIQAQSHHSIEQYFGKT